MSTPQLPLLEIAARTVAPTSLDQWDRIKRDLPLKDLLMVAHVDDYLRKYARYGYVDATGGEMAGYLGRRETQVRPRLTGAYKAGWLVKGRKRKSRVPHEQPCAPYTLAVPREAVERAIREAREKRQNGAEVMTHGG